jgi:uncharacterized protein YjbI with pentapeptide repeats
MMLNSKSIGNKIAEARKKFNLSQAELAQQLSISPQAVGKWERGESLPDIMTLNRLAEIFGLDLNYFSDSFPTIEKEVVTQMSKERDNTVFSKFKDTMGLNWNMSGENYVDADFSGIKKVKDKLSGSSFKKCKLIEADLSDIAFKGNSIIECDFLNANLRNSKFYGSEIKANSFLNTSFIDAVIEASEIRNCDFSNANLSGIEVSTSEFRNNKIENTNWQHASFKETQFTEIIFSGLLEDCSFTSCAFSKATFKNVIIKNSFFKYCDLKRVEFIDCHADKLTYEFLKNGKADMKGITLIL